MESQLHDFVEKVLSINPGYSNLFGGGIPGMSGASVTTIGGSSSASDIVNDLRQATAEFTAKITASAPAPEIAALAERIEGALLNLRMLGQINERFCDTLIQALHTLIE